MHIGDFFVNVANFIAFLRFLCYNLMYGLIFSFISFPHNQNYVAFLFIAAKVQVFVSVCDVLHRFQWYIFLLYLLKNAPKYRKALQYLSANCNRFLQKGVWNYAGTLYLLIAGRSACPLLKEGIKILAQSRLLHQSLRLQGR